MPLAFKRRMSIPYQQQGKCPVCKTQVLRVTCTFEERATTMAYCRRCGTHVLPVYLSDRLRRDVTVTPENRPDSPPSIPEGMNKLVASLQQSIERSIGRMSARVLADMYSPHPTDCCDPKPATFTGTPSYNMELTEENLRITYADMQRILNQPLTKPAIQNIPIGTQECKSIRDKFTPLTLPEGTGEDKK